MRRLISVDYVKSMALLLMVFAHSAAFHYGAIFEIDFDDPPILIAVMAFMTTMGGAFVLMSTVVNTHVSLRRLRSAETPRFSVRRHLCVAGAIIVGLHFLYNYVLGPVYFDFDHSTISLALVPGLIRSGSWTLPDAKRILDTSSLSIIGLNLILLGLIINPVNDLHRRNRSAAYLFLSGAAVLVFLTGFLRFMVYPWVERVYELGVLPLSLIVCFLLEKTYPFLPYAGYVFVGMIFALCLNEERPARYVARLVPVSLFVLIFGLASMLLMPYRVTAVTSSWASRVILELGVLMAVGSTMLWAFEARKADDRPSRVTYLASFAGISLTIFFLDNSFAEVTARVWSLALPGWDQSVPVVLVYALVNIVLWLIILAVWYRLRYRFSFDGLYRRALQGYRRSRS